MKKIVSFIGVLFTLSLLSAVSLEDVMNAALLNDSNLADSLSKLKIAENNVFKSASLYGTSLSFSTSLSGSFEETSTQNDQANQTSQANQVNPSLQAQLSLPLAKWASISIEGSSYQDSISGSLSLNLRPFERSDSAAENALKRAVIDSRSAIRSTLLFVRKEFRSVNVAKAAYEFQRAAVQSAENELTRIQYLVELGTERKSKEISAYSNLIDVQGERDKAENTLMFALQTLSVRTGISIAELENCEDIQVSENRILVDEATWNTCSAELALAKNNVVYAENSLATSRTYPGLSIGSTFNDKNAWSVTAKITISPDLFFQKTNSSEKESLSIQQRAFEKIERDVSTAWHNQQSSLSMAQRNYENALRFVDSAELSYTETALLLERGEASRSALDSAHEKLLSARWRLMQSIESLENARDQLDITWQVLPTAENNVDNESLLPKL